MPDFLRKRWPLFLVLIVFIVCKIPHLWYPYYWDESWPYATAIKAMYKNGISLMPGAIDADLSRGHPLFFHVVAAAWMHVFGDSHIAMHSFALLISVLFLVALYEAGLHLFNERVAFLAVLLTASQVVFFVQSSFVLFEMLIAFLAFLSLYFYSIKRYLLTAVCLSMLFYTKESGLIVGFVIGIDALAGLFDKQRAWKEKLQAIAAVAVPCVLIGLFFIVQKHVMGWYIFPLYSGIIEHSWDMFWYKFSTACLRDTAYIDYRCYYFLLLLLLLIPTFIKSRDLRYLAILPPLCLVYYFVDEKRGYHTLPSILFFIVFLLSCGSFFFIFSRSYYNAVAQRKLIRLAGAFVILFICFSTMNFYTYRYMLSAIVPLLFLVAVVADLFISRSYEVLYYPAIAFILVVSFCSFKHDNSYGDTHLGAFDAMDVQQRMVDYLVQHKCYTANIGCGSYLERTHLTDPSSGFVSPKDSFSNVTWEINGYTNYAIFDNVEPDNRYAYFNKGKYDLVYRYTNGITWGEIYKQRGL